LFVPYTDIFSTNIHDVELPFLKNELQLLKLVFLHVVALFFIFK